MLPQPKGSRRRERARIFYDILRAIINQQASVGTAKITKVQNEVNLPSDRFRAHLQDMEALALVEYRDVLLITAKGRDFVAEFEKVVETLKRFGL